MSLLTISLPHRRRVLYEAVLVYAFSKLGRVKKTLKASGSFPLCPQNPPARRGLDRFCPVNRACAVESHVVTSTTGALSQDIKTIQSHPHR
jgi:hypothetical protein